MATVPEQDVLDETVEEETPEPAPKVKGDKQFSQEELAKHVSAVRRSEKEAGKRALATREAELTEEMDTLRATVEKYESTIKTLVEAKMKGLPKSITDLLAKLDPADQFAWLTEHSEEVTQDKPRSPKPLPNPAGQETADPNEILERKRRQARQF